jgi:peptidoglycan/LPS O-acetylase OafA/YrhL
VTTGGTVDSAASALTERRAGSDPRIYFHGLNELRACAALSVLVAHVELYKRRDGHFSLYDTPLRYFVSHLGENGVSLFFVLSGFLITFLLLEEVARAGDVSLRHFYLRRMLRIWPLYYVILGLGFVVAPVLANLPFFSTEQYYLQRIAELRYGSNLLMHVAFLSNLALLLYPPVVPTSQSWSVSVEEQFYLIWPVLLKAFRRRPLLMLGAVFSSKLAITWLAVRLAHGSPQLGVAARFLQQLKIELMAIGGFAAWWLRCDQERIKRWSSAPAAAALLAVALLAQFVVYGHHLALGICFALLILGVVSRRMTNSWLDRLGLVSYGIYMYHPLCMFVGFAAIHRYLAPSGAAYHALGYGLVLALTLGLSAVSYRWLERPLLKLKERISAVPSGSA